MKGKVRKQSAGFFHPWLYPSGTRSHWDPAELPILRCTVSCNVIFYWNSSALFSAGVEDGSSHNVIQTKTGFVFSGNNFKVSQKMKHICPLARFCVSFCANVESALQNSSLQGPSWNASPWGCTQISSLQEVGTLCSILSSASIL